MIDPSKITNFNLDRKGLEEHAVFWVCVAGKTAKTIAKSLDSIWKEIGHDPFAAIRRVGLDNLPGILKKHGIGCYNAKARSLYELATSGLDLKKCSLKDLESIYGIGPKTARCFMIHTRPNARCAGIDTHVLKFLKDLGHKVPSSTPIGKKYLEIEELFLNYVYKSGKSVAEYDLSVWNAYSSTKNPLQTLKSFNLV